MDWLVGIDHQFDNDWDYQLLLLPDSVAVSMVIFTLVAAIVILSPITFIQQRFFWVIRGALFLGFMISVLSLQGVEECDVYYRDLAYADSGRTNHRYCLCDDSTEVQQTKISSADKMHFHHRFAFFRIYSSGSSIDNLCVSNGNFLLLHC